MKKLTFTCIAVLIAFVFFACDEHGGGGQGGGGGVTGVIGPEGGTITSQDGRLTLTFPPGALSEDTKITVKDIEPGELNTEVDGFDSQFTYSLEPDGIEFNAPVTASFLTDETPVQGDGSIVTEGALLVTTSNGQTELLENLIQDVNANEGTTSVSGELSHFSELSVTRLGINVSVSGVPDSLPVGETFNADVLVAVQADNVVLLLPRYIDQSVLPILRMFENPQSLDFTEFSPLGSAQKSLPYICNSAGDGMYISKLLVDFKTIAFGVVTDERQTVFLFKNVTCVGPPPVEECPQLGSYASMSAGCSIGTFTLSNITSDSLTVTGFGANTGDVEFGKDILIDNYFSKSNNLKIKGEDGHTCTLTCGPGASQLTLKCSNPPNTCTEVFTLQ